MYFEKFNHGRNISPVIVLKRKSDSLKVSYDHCIICQASSKEQLRKSSESGRQKVKECMQKRRKFRDVANMEVLDKLEALNETEWESAELKWHKSCYSAFTSDHHIQWLQKKASESKASDTQATESTSRSGRRSIDPVDWTKCMFCQCVKREDLYNIEYMKKSKQIMEDTSLDPVMRVRLSGISDLPAAEGNYHLSCLVKLKKSARLEFWTGSWSCV